MVNTWRSQIRIQAATGCCRSAMLLFPLLLPLCAFCWNFATKHKKLHLHLEQIRALKSFKMFLLNRTCILFYQIYILYIHTYTLYINISSSSNFVLPLQVLSKSRPRYVEKKVLSEDLNLLYKVQIATGNILGVHVPKGSEKHYFVGSKLQLVKLNLKVQVAKSWLRTREQK